MTERRVDGPGDSFKAVQATLAREACLDGGTRRNPPRRIEAFTFS